MKLEIEFDADKLIDSIMENYPEASSPSLRCISFDYAQCLYTFRDLEGTLDDMHVTRVNLRRGMEILLAQLIAGKLRGIGQHILRNFTDPCNWDSTAADALVQCAIFGEVIYG